VGAAAAAAAASAESTPSTPASAAAAAARNAHSGDAVRSRKRRAATVIEDAAKAQRREITLVE
jgi:hypothetical protein